MVYRLAREAFNLEEWGSIPPGGITGPLAQLVEQGAFNP